MKEYDNLQEIFDSIEITPDAVAKQKAKERMLACARASENSAFAQNNVEIKTKAKSKPRFMISRHHFQGAAAAVLIVFALSVTIPIINMPSEMLQGSLFKQSEELQEISVTVNPSAIEAGEDNMTFTVYGLPENELEQIKPEHIFLGGYLSNFAVQSLEVDGNALVITTVLRETENGEPSVSNNNGVIMVMPAAFSKSSFYYYGEVSVVHSS